MFPLGSRKFFFFPFFFADCHPPASVNGTRCVPPGQSEPSRLVSRVKLLSAGTEPKDTSKKKPRKQLCLQQGGRRVWVSPSCQDVLSRQSEIKYACAEPAVPRGAAAHMRPVKELTQHAESPGQGVPGLLLENRVETVFRLPGLCARDAVC